MKILQNKQIPASLLKTLNLWSLKYSSNNKWLTIFFLNERTFLSHLSSKGEALRWEMTEKRPQVLKNIFNYSIAILYS